MLEQFKVRNFIIFEIFSPLGAESGLSPTSSGCTRITLREQMLYESFPAKESPGKSLGLRNLENIDSPNL